MKFNDKKVEDSNKIIAKRDNSFVSYTQELKELWRIYHLEDERIRSVLLA